MFDNPIGFDRQGRLAGTCGKHSLRHALLSVGIPVAMEDISVATDSGWLRTAAFGIDEGRVIRAARDLGARARAHKYAYRGEMRRAFDAALSRGNALVVCVANERHWVAVCGRYGGEYIWVDSDTDELIGTSPWTELADWMEIRHEGESTYYAIEISADARPASARSAVPRFAAVWDAIDEDDVLRRWWGTYYQWAEHVFGRGSRGHRAAARRVCARYEEFIDDDAQQRELDRLAVVATAHGLSIATSRQRAALERLDESLEHLV